MRILAVGVATIDIINLVERYPPEDSEVRAIERRIRRGGNAANSLVVLSQLGHNCSCCGVIAGAPDSAHILDDLARFDIETRYLVRDPAADNPTSYITLSRQSGSRSIVHLRCLREYDDGDFSAVDLSGFDWVHFEGRNPLKLKHMLGRLASQPQIGVSLEVEKPRQGIEALFSLPALVMFSSGYARHRGYHEGKSFLHHIRNDLAPGAVATCAWGEHGAWGIDSKGNVAHAAAELPKTLVETLGAGDVFNAAAIHTVSAGLNITEVLRRACRLAGRKCGQRGFDGLNDE